MSDVVAGEGTFEDAGSGKGDGAGDDEAEFDEGFEDGAALARAAELTGAAERLLPDTSVTGWLSEGAGPITGRILLPSDDMTSSVASGVGSAEDPSPATESPPVSDEVGVGVVGTDGAAPAAATLAASASTDAVAVPDAEGSVWV